MMRAISGALAALLLLVAPPSVSAQEQGGRESAGDGAARCLALAKEDFSGVADAPTRITATEMVDAKGADPAYCKVTGTIEPTIGIAMNLPTANWNGKFMEVGCGGWCGSIRASACTPALRRGYACIASDMGHKGSPIDVRWAENNLQGQIDFGYRATHVTALAGKAIAARFFGKAPARSYFNGCSTGGYQGVTQAQRFPWDFDGIIAGAPDIDQTQANFRAMWLATIKRDAAGKAVLGKADLALLHNAALAQCDRDDGVKDGIIGNPRGCGFKPESLQCKPGQASACLSPAQVDVARKFYSGPVNAAGDQTSTGSFLIGSELAWADEFPADALEAYFRYGFPGYTTGTKWSYRDFDFNRDYKRFGLAAHYENNNPDLRRLKSAGVKLIIYHGTTDTIDPPVPVIDYYDMVERTMGGRANTQSFFRLFLIPGHNHCYGGAGAWDVDWITALEDWVEKGKAPDALIGTHPASNAGPSFTRPQYPYPAFARYKGKGDPNKAENFRPVVEVAKGRGR